MTEADEWREHARVNLNLLCRAEEKNNRMRELLIECMELSENWPGIPYTENLKMRISAAVGPNV